MIRLDQIRTLEERVKKAVALIDDLKEENRSLKDKLGSYHNRITELEVLIEDFKRDQGEIEQGIISAISQLDSLEGSEVTDTQPQPDQTPVSSVEDDEPADDEPAGEKEIPAAADDEPAVEEPQESEDPVRETAASPDELKQVDQTPVYPVSPSSFAYPDSPVNEQEQEEESLDEEDQPSELDIF